MCNLRESVRFAATTGRPAEDGHEIFVEVRAHPVLLSSLWQTMESTRSACVPAFAARAEKKNPPMIATPRAAQS
ncbi:hypothetical protein ACW4TU_00460 [Streptomyces sp. QTS52]